MSTLGEFRFANNDGPHATSSTYYPGATERERAIARLHTMAGDPSIEAVCEEQEEARQLLKQLIREDPELRSRLRFWKQFADAPNGKERLWKEIVLPKCMSDTKHMRNRNAFILHSFAYIFKCLSKWFSDDQHLTTVITSTIQ